MLVGWIMPDKWRKKLAFMALVLIISIGIIPGATLALAEGEDPQPPQQSLTMFEHRLNLTVPRLMRKYACPGAALALIEDGKVVWVKGYGWAVTKEHRRVNRDTIFQVASISKTLTAWGIMRLVARGKLDLDVPVERYLTHWRLPSSKFNPDQVTIRRILSHTAGLSVSSYPGYSPSKQLKRLPSLEQSLSGSIDHFSALKIIHPPGSKFAYSGGGYTLLQMVIENVTGMRFSEYMRREILEPLRMTHSSFVWEPGFAPQLAQAYGILGEPIPNYLFTEEAAAGLYTTAGDLAQFTAMNNNIRNSETGGLLTAKDLAVMQRPVKKNSGLGYMIYKSAHGDPWVGHPGENRGWNSIFATLPSQNAGLVILTNSNAGGQLVKDINNLWVQWRTGAGLASYREVKLGRALVQIGAGVLGLGLLVFLVLMISRLARGKCSFGLKVTKPLILGIMGLVFWWVFFFTGLPYHGWIIASLMPAGFLWLTAAVSGWCLILMIKGGLIHD
jgi:CubicO group peptidase (beta-lactamase class C family)